MRIFNTYSRQKEVFSPYNKDEVKIYVCGPTVYNYFHIGNARTFMFFDVVRRYFSYSGYKVTFVQNLTDIDDKLINQSIKENIPVAEIASKYIDAFFEDCAALGIWKADHTPRATEYIEQMILLIKEMEEKDFAYEVNGDVYFSVEKSTDYGCLSGKKIDELKAGARIEENEQKKHPADFTLWKKAKPGEPFWDSPWGKGRPGWHTECVVMSRDFLGDVFDIHAGAIDLVFPHHENEIAQAKATGGKNHARYWMHGGFLNFSGEKMSKSLDNFFLTRDVLKKYDAETIRFFFLSKHYRSPVEYGTDYLAEADRAVDSFYNALRKVNYLQREEGKAEDYSQEISKIRRDFIDAMDDDFNTAKAIASLFELSKIARDVSHTSEVKMEAACLMVDLGKVLGFFSNVQVEMKKRDKSGFNSLLSREDDIDANINVYKQLSISLVELLINYRNEYKKQKNWKEADRIRDNLKAYGVVIKDTSEGVVWEIEKKY